MNSVVGVNDGGVAVRELVKCLRERGVAHVVLHVLPRARRLVSEDEVHLISGTASIRPEHDGVRRVVFQLAGAPTGLLQSTGTSSWHCS